KFPKVLVRSSQDSLRLSVVLKLFGDIKHVNPGVFKFSQPAKHQSNLRQSFAVMRIEFDQVIEHRLGYVVALHADQRRGRFPKQAGPMKSRRRIVSQGQDVAGPTVGFRHLDARFPIFKTSPKYLARAVWMFLQSTGTNPTSWL